MNTYPDNNTQMKDYLDRAVRAYAFAQGQTGEAWNGLFLMGLTLQDLDLIPVSSSIERKSYWLKALPPQGCAEDWPESWIAERDALYGTNKENEQGREG